MRVIAGDYKGRTLKSGKGLHTRPTGDKLKEAIFHRIGPFFEGGNCLDLFAGSGSLGIEALSRGMQQVVFIDNTKEAIRVIRQNVNNLKLSERCEIYRNDAFRALQILQKKKQQFDLVLLDPPYDKVNYQQLMDQVSSSDILKDEAIIYIEHRPEEHFTYDETIFAVVSKKKLNQTTSFTILQKR